MTERREFRQHRFLAPGGACEILLVRHGESSPLIEGESFPLVGGHADPPLAPDGHVQAVQTADRLIATGERIAAIYVTSLTRTHQTAAPLAERLGLEPAVVADLREVFLGDWEGGEFRHRLADEDPIAITLFETGRWDAIPNGEPTEQFEARVRAGIETIAAAHPDELVVAVVHGGVIGQIMNIIADTTGFRFGGADNASISHIVIEADRWRLRCFNDTSHLSPTFSTTPQPLT